MSFPVPLYPEFDQDQVQDATGAAGSWGRERERAACGSANSHAADGHGWRRGQAAGWHGCADADAPDGGHAGHAADGHAAATARGHAPAGNRRRAAHAG